ncbi:hypothetical protein pdam_00001617 [Pocillopora damicornis]|uniref:Uncharacterized protein n=1 Tax=Pocillopora damicornis TaxID=46731 RepID=A0A3M6U5E9_POCDA|nr:hypothetical protein pdam_00001617 [Pocillopora damicornis]
MQRYGVEFHKGVPSHDNIKKWFGDILGGILVLDDLMSEGGDDKEILNLFTQCSHHMNVMVEIYSKDGEFVYCAEIAIDGWIRLVRGITMTTKGRIACVVDDKIYSMMAKRKYDDVEEEDSISDDLLNQHHDELEK